MSKAFQNSHKKILSNDSVQKDKALKAFFSSPLVDPEQTYHEDEEEEKNEHATGISGSLPLNPLMQLDIPSHIAKDLERV